MSIIQRQYVITPSVAVLGALPLDTLNQNLKPKAIACNAFLSRAAFPGAELHVPIIFYSNVTRLTFELYQSGLFDFETCKFATREILSETWEYHFPTTDDILEVSREFPKFDHAEYLALARDKRYLLIYTDSTYSTFVKQDGILVNEHPWATDGDLDKYPPTDT